MKQLMFGIAFAFYLVGQVARAEEEPKSQKDEPAQPAKTEEAAPPTSPPATPPPSTPPPAPPTPIQPPTSPALPRIVAGYQEKGKDFVIARNYVDFTYEQYRLQCDLLHYDTKTQEIEATGNVILQDKNERLAGERFVFSLKTNHGVMFDASGTAPPDLHFTANQVEKYDERKYKSKGGRFTSCTQPNPRWEISSSSADMEMDDHVTLRNAIFRVKSAPIFYLPYMRYPTPDDDRATGFLLPNYGHSSIKGTFFGEAFFWAINRSQDATFAYRYFSEMGQGAEGEYRYILPNAFGQLNFFKAFQKGGEEIPAGAGQRGTAANNLEGYFLGIKHQQTLPFDITNSTDVLIMTSQAFKWIYGNNFYNLADPRKSSSTFFSKNFTYDSINLQLRRDEALRGLTEHKINVGTPRKPKWKRWYTEDSVVSAYFPDLALTHNQQEMGETGLLLFGNASFLGYRTYSRSINTADNSEKIGPIADYSKAQWTPAISYPITAVPWITFNPTAKYSGTWWNDSYLPYTTTLSGSSLFRNTFIASVQVFGPNFNRIFSTPESSFSKKWKHSIEPFFQFDYDTKYDPVKQAQVLLSARDSIGYGQRVITYQLTNTLWGKRALVPGMEPSPVDIVRWTLRQSYLPAVDIVDPDTGHHLRFTPLTSDLTFRLQPYVNFSYRTSFDVNYAGFSSHQLNLNLTRSDSFSFNLSWSRDNNLKAQKVGSDSYGLTGGFGIKRIGFRLDGNLVYTPSFENEKLQNVNLRWSQSFQCWGIEVVATRYKNPATSTRDNPFEKSITFAVHIGSIGTISQRIGGATM
ncbi:MAG: hypothetical protein AB1714_14550 [Acidobacteriota bacterium]